MTSHAFGAFIEVESSPGSSGKEQDIPIAPQKALPRVYHSMPLAPDAIELDSIPWGTRLNGPSESGTSTPTGCQTPRAPLDVESRPASPVHEVDAMQELRKPTHESISASFGLLNELWEWIERFSTRSAYSLS